MIVRTKRREDDATKNRSWIRPNNTAGVVRNHVVTTLLLVSVLLGTTKISRTTTTALAFTPPLPLRHHHKHYHSYQLHQQQNPSVSRRPTTTVTRLIASSSSSSLILASSFFGKFEEEDFDEDDDEDDDDEDEDEDDEDEYDNLDDRTVADFRTRMASLFDDSTNTDDDDEDEDQSIAEELLLFSTFPTDSASSTTPKEWAEPATVVREGCILAANPRAFCSDFGSSNNAKKKSSSSISPQLLSKFGLTLPPPADLGADRRADLLPVLVVVEYDAASQRARAVLLNRRTGYLLGDLEQQQQQQQSPPSSTTSDSSSTASSSSSSPTPLLEKFCIQPLWFGGVDSGGSSSNGGGGGLDMLHQCPTVAGARQITPDGLFWGGDPAQAQDAMSDPSLERVFTGFDFKFFVQSTAFGPGELQRELENETFFCATVSKEILFKSRDRMGTRRAKPLWTEIMELMGGEYRRVRDRLYGMDDLDDEEEESRPQDYL